jgi:transcriptional regulator with XRE-family HTH domain
MPKVMMTDKDSNAPIRKCEECGGIMEGRRENYHYTECGLQSVRLKNILVFHCGCGAMTARIPFAAWLHRAILFDLIQKKSLLSGEEIKFLRKMAGLNGVELSEALGIHKTTLSKWENNARRITKNSDAALRLMCFIGMIQHVLQQKDLIPKVKEAVKQLSSMDINHILQMIKETMEGSKNIKLDPEALPLLGFPGDSCTGTSFVQ